jgi:hypothetical protein
MEQDIDLFISWGIDYLKVDGCNEDMRLMWQDYPRLGRMLKEKGEKAGRPIVYSCSWPAYIRDHMETTENMELLKEYCNTWRNWYDIADTSESVGATIQYWSRKGPKDVMVAAGGVGHWNDPDMLVAGNPGTSFAWQFTQFSLWAIFAAPMYISADVRKMPEETRRMLLNMEILAVSQDPLARQGWLLKESQGNYAIYIRPLANTVTPSGEVRESVALVFRNTRTMFNEMEITLKTEEIAWTESDRTPRKWKAGQVFFARDIGAGVNHKVLPGVVSVRVDMSSSVMLRLTQGATPASIPMVVGYLDKEVASPQPTTLRLSAGPQNIHPHKAFIGVDQVSEGVTVY